MRLSERLSASLKVAAPLLALMCVALVMLFAPRSHRSEHEPALTPNLDAYNKERAVRLGELRQATVFVYPDIADPRWRKMRLLLMRYVTQRA